MAEHFDYGTDSDIKESGKKGNEKLIPEGDYAARLTAIIHLGVAPKENFAKTASEDIGQAVAVFELVDTDEEKDIFEDDGETHQVLLKDFTLKKGGGKSDMDKIIAFGDPKAQGFDDLIDNVYTVKVVHSKCGKYANLAGFSKGGLSSYPKKFWTSEAESQIKVGHTPFNAITREGIELLHAWNHVADILLKGINYSGSEAERIVEEIRAEEGREDFGKKVKKSKDSSKEEAKPKQKLSEEEDADVEVREY